MAYLLLLCLLDIQISFDLLTNLLKTITMKKIILLMVISMAILSVNAQEKVKQKELGLVFRNFDNFGIMYKFGNQNSMWRLKSVYGNSLSQEQKSDSDETNNSYFSGGLSFGKQFTVSLDKQFDFIYGADVSFGYSRSVNEREYSHEETEGYNKNETYEYRPGLNLLLGFNYVINERIVLGAELLPGAYYSYGKSSATSKKDDGSEEIVESDNTKFIVGISSSSALLSLAYRF